jgi:hypothetical protein
MKLTNLRRHLRRGWAAVLILAAGALAAVPAARAQEEHPEARRAREEREPATSFYELRLRDERTGERGGFQVFLRLPSDRARRLEALQSEMENRSRQLQGRLRERWADLELLYRSYRYDAAKCEQLERVIRETQNQLLDLHRRFQKELRSLLTEAEFERLQQQLRITRERRPEPERLERELGSARERVSALERRLRELPSAPEQSTEREWVERELRTARNRVAELESQWRALRSAEEQHK